MISVNETLKVLKERRSIRKYKKEQVAPETLDAILDVDTRYATDWSAIKQSIKADLSNYLYKKTKRSPMILPVIMEV